MNNNQHTRVFAGNNHHNKDHGLCVHAESKQQWRGVLYSEWGRTEFFM
jgi:hypothetical protein